MRVLIVGSAGQDGSLLVDNFLKLGHTVFGSSLSQGYYPSINSGNYHQMFVQLSDWVIAKKVLDELKPDYIFHMGAVHAASGDMKALGEHSRGDMYLCHVSITLNILEWMRVNYKSKLVVALSSQMYSPKNENVIIDESAATSPSSVYGETKSEAFTLIKKYREDYQVWVSGAILFNHTSIRAKSSFLFPQIAQQFRENERMGGGIIKVRNANSYLDISSAVEVCSGLVKMIFADVPEDFVFGSGKLCQIKDLIYKVSKLMGEIHEYEIVSENSTPGGPQLVSNPRKAQEILGWSPVLTPEEILAQMIEGKLA